MNLHSLEWYNTNNRPEATFRGSVEMTKLGKLIWATVALLLTASILGNVLLYSKVNDLERVTRYLNVSLVTFGNVTGAIVKQCKMSPGDVKRSGMITTPPSAEGTGYLIDVDDLHDRGIKYFFNPDGKLVGWCAVQPQQGQNPKTLECLQHAQPPGDTYSLQ